MIHEQYVTKVIDTTINIVNSGIESIRNKNIARTGQRVYHDGFIGVSGAIGSFVDSELLHEAREALGKKIEYPAKPSINMRKSLDMRESIIDPLHLKGEVEALLCELRDRQPGFIFSNKISLTETAVSLADDRELNLEYTDRCLSFGLIFKEKSSSNLLDGSIGFQERKYDRKLILDEFDLILNAYTEKAALPGDGRYPVIFFSEEAPVEKLITDLKADVFAQGGSIFSGKQGQLLFNESFTFGQNLDPKKVCNTPFFDAEGTVNPGYVFNLIENGVLKAPYCDRKTACKYGFEPSGSAASPYDGVPQTALLRPNIKQTEQDVEALLGGQPGIIILMAAGGDFTPAGDYATPVQLAMLFDGKRFLGRLPEFNLSSNVYEMFGEGFRGVAPNTFLPFFTGELTVLEMNVASI